ncbi:molecular chaperone Hsp33 [Marinimicrobium koreense]|uniref:33 kDa chaperonin n=1 Tax=Marinimicrobium koreense TaxID=306545 RepID=A0A3N1NFH4_9GAMM|nr:Hsp33 family molecular chaperone HslO [Marinimicrobium koreense]ROQ18654.1 molecular chaperone Hsp33 [Marinimicrobium koreense]
MFDNDLLHRFLFDECDVRGEIVTLGASYREVMNNNPYPEGVRELLGEFLAAVALLSSTLKFNGMISLQAQGDGAVSMVMAECDHHKNLRGIIRLKDSADRPQGRGVGELLGKGIMAITIEPERGERYQGVVPMDSDNLAECLEHYFYQSEQLKTRLWFATGEHACTGLMLQALPTQKHADPDENRDHWETLGTLASTVKDEELLGLPHADVLYRLFNEYQLRLFDPSELRFRCSCSRERSANALLSLGREEVDQLLIEQGGKISIDCQFCNQHYSFNAGDIQALLGDQTLH